MMLVLLLIDGFWRLVALLAVIAALLTAVPGIGIGAGMGFVMGAGTMPGLRVIEVTACHIPWSEYFLLVIVSCSPSVSSLNR